MKSLLMTRHIHSLIFTFLLLGLPVSAISGSPTLARDEAIWIPKKVSPDIDNKRVPRQQGQDISRSNERDRRHGEKSQAQRHNKQHWNNDRYQFRKDPETKNRQYTRENNPQFKQRQIIQKRVVIDQRKNHHRYNIYKPEKYIYYRTPWYNTRYIEPVSYPYSRIGHRVNILPRSYVEIAVRGTPYFYYSGTYYKRNLTGGYLVVSAPIGASVRNLPAGFIAFSLGLLTYYYVNDTYYAWNEPRNTYVVIDKPVGATEAIVSETMGRLMVYPNSQQNEELQAKDRYECHQWAVNQTGHDPSLVTDNLTDTDRQDYRRAISACLEGRDYTVK